ncbi:Predicted nucleic acid-binding protein, contains PIN domain [Rhizobiales bacterium GAS113]|jgi:predicted nucleic acid-binding protein|nr:Predicted nucleic acid-binding protein, contains PIN domain [Rhizobiales bacterium GAS113]SEC19000.1 Predicted nucleic acid-binding protein, contains PIN domain [Rhizobiales bacterium GAS188]
MRRAPSPIAGGPSSVALRPALRVYVDTNVLIRGMERTDAGAGEAARLTGLAELGKLRLVTSELTLSELLVGPIGRRDHLLETAYLDLLTLELLIELVPVSREVLIEAAHIRARSAAPLADCLHVATARLAGCGLIVSYDRRLRELSDLEVTEPSDALFARLEGEPS